MYLQYLFRLIVISCLSRAQQKLVPAMPSIPICCTLYPVHHYIDSGFKAGEGVTLDPGCATQWIDRHRRTRGQNITRTGWLLILRGDSLKPKPRHGGQSPLS